MSPCSARQRSSTWDPQPASASLRGFSEMPALWPTWTCRIRYFGWVLAACVLQGALLYIDNRYSKGRCSSLLQGLVSGVCTHGAGLLVRCPPSCQAQSLLHSLYQLMSPTGSMAVGEMARSKQGSGALVLTATRSAGPISMSTAEAKILSIRKNAQHGSLKLSFIWG